MFSFECCTWQSFKLFLARWVFSSNHKNIGLLYFIFAFFAAAIGTVYSFFIRIELSVPESTYFATNYQLYNITIFWLLMIFFFVMPCLIVRYILYWKNNKFGFFNKRVFLMISVGTEGPQLNPWILLGAAVVAGTIGLFGYFWFKKSKLDDLPDEFKDKSNFNKELHSSNNDELALKLDDEKEKSIPDKGDPKLPPLPPVMQAEGDLEASNPDYDDPKLNSSNNSELALKLEEPIQNNEIKNKLKPSIDANKDKEELTLKLEEPLQFNENKIIQKQSIDANKEEPEYVFDKIILKQSKKVLNASDSSKDAASLAKKSAKLENTYNLTNVNENLQEGSIPNNVDPAVFAYRFFNDSFQLDTTKDYIRKNATIIAKNHKYQNPEERELLSQEIAGKSKNFSTTKNLVDHFLIQRTTSGKSDFKLFHELASEHLDFLSKKKAWDGAICFMNMEIPQDCSDYW